MPSSLTRQSSIVPLRLSVTARRVTSARGSFSPAEAEAIFNSLPSYLADVARFAYERAIAPVRFGSCNGRTWNRMLSAFQRQSRRTARKNRLH